MRRRHEHVSDTTHCANGSRVGWIEFYLATQTGDPQVNGAVERLHLTVCRYFEQPVALERYWGVLRKP